MIDYKLLLTKYINHIVECEGTDFVYRMLTQLPDPMQKNIGDLNFEILIFTFEEIKEIKNLSGFDESIQ